MSQGRLLAGLLWFAPLVLALVYCRPARLRPMRQWYDRFAAVCVTVAGVAFLLGTKGLFQQPKATTWLACFALVVAVQMFLPMPSEVEAPAPFPQKGPSLVFVTNPDLLWLMLLGNGLVTLVLFSLFLRKSDVPMGSRLVYALLCTLFFVAPLALLYRGLLWSAGRRAMAWIMAMEGLRLFWIGLSLLAYHQTHSLLPAKPALAWLTHWRSGPRHDLSVTPRLFVGACILLLFLVVGLQLLYQWLYVGWVRDESASDEHAQGELVSSGAQKFLLWGCAGVLLLCSVWVHRLPAKRRAILYQQVPGIAVVHSRMMRAFRSTTAPPLGPFLAQRKRRFLLPPKARPPQVSRSAAQQPDIVLLMIGGLGADALQQDRMPRWTRLLATAPASINRQHLGGSGAKGSFFDTLSTLHGVSPHRLDLLQGQAAWPLEKLRRSGYDVEWLRPKGAEKMPGVRFDREHELAKTSFHSVFQQVHKRLQRGEVRQQPQAPRVRPRPRQPRVAPLLRPPPPTRLLAPTSRPAAPTSRKAQPTSRLVLKRVLRAAPRPAAKPSPRPRPRASVVKRTRKPLFLLVTLPLWPRPVLRSAKMCRDYRKRLLGLDLAMHRFWSHAKARVNQRRLAFLWTGSHGWMPKAGRKQDLAWMRYAYVPLVMFLPHKGRRRIRRSSHVDLLPTILDVAGIKLPRGQVVCDGQSLRDAQQPSHTQILSLPLSGPSGVLWTTKKNTLYGRWGPRAGLQLLRAETHLGGKASGETKSQLGAFAQAVKRMWRPGKLPLWALQGDAPTLLPRLPGDGICHSARIQAGHSRKPVLITHPLSAQIGGFVQVLGFDLLRKTRRGRDHVTIKVVIKVLKPLGKIRVFFHLKGKGYFRNKDRKLFQAYKPTSWKAGDVVSGVYGFSMPEGKTVRLSLGLWNRKGRLRATGADAARNYVKLVTLSPR